MLVGLYAERQADDDPSRPPIGPECPAIPDYGLTLADASAGPIEELSIRSTDAAIWKEAGSETYLTLSVRHGLAAAQSEPTGLGPMTEVSALQSGTGRIWISSAVSHDGEEPPTRVQLWWTRADGDVWLAATYWYGSSSVLGTWGDRDRATLDWVQSITTNIGGDSPFALAVSAYPGLELVSAQTRGSYRSWERSWKLDRGTITISTMEGVPASGLKNLLDAGPIAPVKIAESFAWQVQHSDGSIETAWRAPGNAWVTVMVSDDLTDRTPEILAAVKSSGGPVQCGDR